jgi:hypothetical protein
LATYAPVEGLIMGRVIMVEKSRVANLDITSLKERFFCSLQNFASAAIRYRRSSYPQKSIPVCLMKEVLSDRKLQPHALADNYLVSTLPNCSFLLQVTFIN